MRTLTLLSTIVGASAMASAPPRRPWEFGRFLSTAAAFNSPMDALARALGGPGAPVRLARGDTIWSPAQPNGCEFSVLDDVVMGGCSKSEVALGADGLRWSGEVTSANNGGFTGVRVERA